MLAMSCVAMVTGSSDEAEQIEVLITGDVHWLVMVRLTGDIYMT